MVVVLLGCRRDPTAVAAESGYAAELLAAHATLIAAADASSARAALASFEALLDAAVEPSQANTAAWLLALTRLEQLERAGWRTTKRSFAHAIERVADSELAASRPVADPIEAAAAVWLLRRAELGIEAADADALARRLPRSGWSRFAGSTTTDHGWTLVLLARAARERGELDDARAALELASATVGVDGAAALRLRCFLALESASIDQELGRHGDAQQRLVTAAALVDAADSGIDLAIQRELEQLVALARVRQAVDVGEWERARRFADRLLAKTEDGALRAQVEFYRAFATWSSGDRVTASPGLHAAMTDRRLEPKLAAMARLELVSGALAAGEYDRARELLGNEAGFGGDDPRGAWPLLAARAMACAARLAVATGAADAKARIAAAGAAFRDFVDMCARSHDPIGNAPFAFAPRRQLVEDILDLYGVDGPDHAGVIAATEEMMRVRSRGALSRAIGGTAPTIGRVRDGLLRDARDRLVLLVPARRHTHVFVIGKDSIAHHRGGAPEQVDEAAVAVWRELVTPSALTDPQSSARLFGHAQRLAALLFGDVLAADLSAARRLLLVGGEVLRRVPLEALVLPTPRGGREASPLGLTHEIAYLPSSAAALALAERVRERSPTAGLRAHVLIGKDDAVGGAVAFPDDARERLERTIPGLRWLRRFVDVTTAGDHLAIWFAHGVEDPERSRSRGMLLEAAGDLLGERVFAEHFEKGGFRASPIHVLAICEGLNTEPKLGGEDVDHLGATLLEVGSASVLASAAPLHQEATAVLIAAIVERVVAGESIAAAMRSARCELASSERYCHPHYWATLTLFGLPDALRGLK
jgi:hypothetical protein